MTPSAVAILDTELAHTRRRIAAVTNRLSETSDPDRRLRLIRVLDRLVESANRLAWGAELYSGNFEIVFNQKEN